MDTSNSRHKHKELEKHSEGTYLRITYCDSYGNKSKRIINENVNTLNINLWYTKLKVPSL